MNSLLYLTWHLLFWKFRCKNTLVNKVLRLCDLSSQLGYKSSIPLLVVLAFFNFEQNILQSSFNDSIIKLWLRIKWSFKQFFSLYWSFGLLKVINQSQFQLCNFSCIAIHPLQHNVLSLQIYGRECPYFSSDAAVVFFEIV